ncbi:MAG: patatin-like phospholipase family protein [Alphaproteobacteria bacterium]|nr:patatin-like phospholipase family protein [Alphaproteobacteria bacterium]
MAIALMLGGGAPTLTLETGALAALDEMGAKFDAVSTAGAGMVVGLLYAAPKGKTRQQALADSKHMGVHDSIYSRFPINFKVFHKPGPMAEAYRNFLGAMPRIAMGNSSPERFFNDWMALMFSTFCPSDLGLSSKGLCEHAPWIDDIVDFEKLKAFSGEFYMNAYNVTDQKMDIFDKDEITPAHFRSSLAFPMIYAPYKLNGKTYIEGSAIDTLCFRGLLEYRDDRIKKKKDLDPLEHIVVFDVLSSKKIIREPQNLYESWIQSIMIPLVEIAKDDIKMYEHIHSKNWKKPPKIKRIKFDIPKDHWPHVLDWSYSNLEILYDVGYRAGMKFYKKNEKIFSKKNNKKEKIK